MATKKLLHFERRTADDSTDGMTFPENEPEAEAPASMLPATRSEALAVPDRAQAIVVHDQAGLDTAKAFLHDIDALQAQIDETFDKQISQAHKLHKSLLAEKARFSLPLESAKRLVSRKAADFVAEQDRVRREAERERLAAEARARELVQKAAEKADKMVNDGKDLAAVKVVDDAAVKVNEILGAAPEVPEKLDTSGLAVMEHWKFDIVEHSLLPREYLMPDEKKIGRIVRAQGAGANIPGVRVYCEKGVATRSPRADSQGLN